MLIPASEDRSPRPISDILYSNIIDDFAKLGLKDDTLERIIHSLCLVFKSLETMSKALQPYIATKKEDIIEKSKTGIFKAFSKLMSKPGLETTESNLVDGLRAEFLTNCMPGLYNLYCAYYTLLAIERRRSNNDMAATVENLFTTTWADLFNLSTIIVMIFQCPEAINTRHISTVMFAVTHFGRCVENVDRLWYHYNTEYPENIFREVFYDDLLYFQQFNENVKYSAGQAPYVHSDTRPLVDVVHGLSQMFLASMIEVADEDESDMLMSIAIR